MVLASQNKPLWNHHIIWTTDNGSSAVRYVLYLKLYKNNSLTVKHILLNEVAFLDVVTEDIE